MEQIDISEGQNRVTTQPNSKELTLVDSSQEHSISNHGGKINLDVAKFQEMSHSHKEMKNNQRLVDRTTNQSSNNHFPSPFTENVRQPSVTTFICAFSSINARPIIKVTYNTLV